MVNENAIIQHEPKTSGISLPYRLLSADTDMPLSLLGGFASATLRGGLGYALKKVSCTAHGVPCAACGEAACCPYALCYETVGNGPVPPRPFISRAENSGNRLKAVLTLFGGFAHGQDVFIRAMEILGEMGMGKQNRRFRILGATGANEGDISHLKVAPGASRSGTADIELLTPLSFRVGRQIADTFIPELFFTRSLERVVRLAQYYGTGALSKNERADIEKASAGVGLEWASTRFHRFDRDSTRQKRRIVPRGIIGRVRVSGDMGVLGPLLRAVEITGVGRDTVLGFGHIRLVENREDA